MTLRPRGAKENLCNGIRKKEKTINELVLFINNVTSALHNIEVYRLLSACGWIKSVLLMLY